MCRRQISRVFLHYSASFFGVHIVILKRAVFHWSPFRRDFYLCHQEANVVALIFTVHRRFIISSVFFFVAERGLNSLMFTKFDKEHFGQIFSRILFMFYVSFICTLNTYFMQEKQRK